DPDRGPASVPVDDAAGHARSDEETDREPRQRDTEPSVPDADVVLDGGNTRCPGAERGRVDHEHGGHAEPRPPKLSARRVFGGGSNGSTGHFRRTHEQSPRVLTTAP